MADKSCRLPRRARVVRNERLTPTGTFLVRFEAVDGEPFAFEPGQFVAIDCLDRRLGYRRSPYCVASAPTRNGVFDLLVRRVPDGPVSLFLTDLEADDVVSFRGPAGASLPLPADDRELVLVATGVGISPLLPLLATVIHRDPLRPVSLYWGLRQVEDVCLLEEIDALGRRLLTFRLAISLSRPDAAWTGLAGRLTESLPPLLATLGDKHFYLCGNGAMIVELTDALALAGVPRGRIHEEPFFNTKHRPSPEAVRAIRERIPATDVLPPYESAARMGRDR